MIENIDAATYYEVIKQHAVVVDFSAPWCGDCRYIEPMLDTLQDNFKHKVAFYKISFDTETKLKDELNIRKIPTLIFYKNGKEVGDRLIEPRSIESIKQAIQSLIDSSFE